MIGQPDRRLIRDSKKIHAIPNDDSLEALGKSKIKCHFHIVNIFM